MRSKPAKKESSELKGRSALFTPLAWIARWLLRFNARYPNALLPLKQLIKKNPKIWLFVRNKVVFGASENYGYFNFDCDGFILRFYKGGVQDPRGIGRVSREYLAYFRRKFSEQLDKRRSVSNNPVVHLFTSIHWCPLNLPDNSVVIIHDVIPLVLPDHFPSGVIHEWRTRYKYIATQASKVITISEASAWAIQHFLEVSRDRIDVIHNGVTPLTDVMKPVPTPAKPFVVYVGAADFHKNLKVVFEALKMPRLRDVDLVLIGDNRSAAGLALQYGLVDRVSFLGYLEDAQMVYVLRHSLGLVFPSLFEGFGLPPLEAATIGVASVCSRRPAMTELLNENITIFCEPDEPEEWADAILHLADRPFSTDVLKQFVAEHYSYDSAGDRLFRACKSSSAG